MTWPVEGQKQEVESEAQLVASGTEGYPDPQAGNLALLGQARELANLSKIINLNSEHNFISTS